MQIAICKIAKNKVLQYSRGNFIQYLVITCNGKEYVCKVHVYVCETESLCYVCKSTILQYIYIYFFFFKEGRSLREVGVWGDGRKFEFGIAENKRGIDENKLGILGPC